MLSAPDASSLDARFAAAMASPDERIDLAHAALLIAVNVHPNLDVDACLRRLDALADALRARLPDNLPAIDRIGALNRFLFHEQGFRANVDDYYDPRNSCLNDVLDRKVGIPITLSLIYMEVGRRIGLSLQGVGFPGHFLVRCALSEGLLVLDPFDGGRSLGIDELRRRLEELLHRDVAPGDVAAYLAGASPREMLARMLRNLKAIYTERQDYLRALPFAHWITLAVPDNVDAVRDRGIAYMKLDCFRAALSDLERYLELAPAANDHDEIRGHVVQLRRSAARLN